MDLKDAIISAVTGSDTSKKTNKPYTYADIVFKADNGTVIRKRVFLFDFEKQLLKIEN